LMHPGQAHLNSRPCTGPADLDLSRKEAIQAARVGRNPPALQKYAYRPAALRNLKSPIGPFIPACMPLVGADVNIFPPFLLGFVCILFALVANDVLLKPYCTKILMNIGEFFVLAK
jgi:hypothetical protein